MSIMMLVMPVMLIIVLGIGLAVFISARQLPPSSAPPQDRSLAEQAERIELLEDELQRVKDQADFTERLLTERGGVRSGDALEGDVSAKDSDKN